MLDIVPPHKDYSTCMYAHDFETICCNHCGLCKFPELFANYIDKKKKSYEFQLVIEL